MGRSDASDTLAKEEYKVKVDPTYVDQEGRTQLHLAVLQATDNVCVIRHMLDAGCDVTARDRMGQTPIHMASERGYVASLGCMLDLKPDLEVKDARGLTPLMVAARYGQAVALKRLLAKGAEVNACTDQSQTTLHFAAGGGHLECTDLLLFAGAKVNYTDDIKNTPLLMACRFGHVAVARRLLKSGANPKLGDDMGSCPLHWVAETGNSACAKVLIEAGACVDSVDHQGTTPFLRAIQNNTPEVLKLLVDAGCDRTRIDGLMGTALVLASLKGFYKCVEILLGAGDDPDEVGYFGMTPLMSACFESNLDLVNLLLDNGADANALGRTCATPLIKSLIMVVPQNEKARHQLVARLIRANADVNYRVINPGYFTACTNGRNCPLSFAIASGYMSLVRMLLLAGCRVTCEEVSEWLNKDSDTGLFFQMQDIVKPLKKYKSEPQALKYTCRLLIRRALGKQAPRKIQKLNIAVGLKKFLDFEDLERMPVERAALIKGFNPGMRDFLNVTPCGLRAIEGTMLYDTLQGSAH